jgi:hypothetical protein
MEMRMEPEVNGNINYLQKRKPGQTLKEKVIKYNKNDISFTYKLGIAGEEFTAKILEGLGSEYKILHSIPFSEHKKDIDHIVIGPTGIYIINSKNYRAKSLLIDDEYIIYNKKRLSDPIDLQRDVRYVENLFKVKDVFPIISLVNNNSLRIKSSKISKVLHANKIVNYIKKQEAIYSEDYINKVYSEMSNCDIWGIKNIKDPDFIEEMYISKMSSKEKRVDYELNEKVIGIVLALFLGVFGAHRLYYEKYKLYCISLGLFILSFFTNLIPILYIWIIIDIILIIKGKYYIKNK